MTEIRSLDITEWREINGWLYRCSSNDYVCGIVRPCKRRATLFGAMFADGGGVLLCPEHAEGRGYDLTTELTG